MGGRIFFIKGFFLLFLFLPFTNLLWAQSDVDSLKEEAYRIIDEGNKIERQNAYIDAERKYLNAVEVWKKIPGYDEYRAYPYYSLAVLYRKMGNFKKSLDNYSQAERILLYARKEFYYLLSANYQSMGFLFLDLGDYTKALFYFNKSIQTNELPEERNESVYSSTVFNIAQVYFYQRKFQRALDICDGYLKNPKAVNRSRFEWFIGNCLVSMERYDEAVTILNKSLLGLKNQPERYTEAFLIATKAYIRSGNLKKAEEYLTVASKLLKENKAQNDPWNSYFYELKSEFLIKKADKCLSAREKAAILGNALKTLDHALLMNSSDKGSEKIPYIDTAGRFTTPAQVKDLMINRARTLNAISESYYVLNDTISSRQFELLSLKAWEATVHFLHDLRLSFLEEESKLSLSELQAEVYKEGFTMARKLYSSTGDDNYFHQMLFFSESGKSSTLLASLNTAQAKNFGGIPDSLLTKEKELSMQLMAMDQVIFNARSSNQPDSLLLTELVKNQFETQKQLDELMFRFENEFPDYYRFKYNNLLITSTKICSKLGKKDALIEYFIDEPSDETDTGQVNILYFTKGRYTFYSKTITYEYVKNLRQLLDQLTDHNVGETNLDDYRRFVSSANYLYSVLIEPIAIDNSTTNLIIIPDGKLAYLSFDALISKLPDLSKISFSKPDYLVRRFNFVYSYSATLHYDYFKSNASTNNNILAFSPNYSGGEIDMNQAAYRDRQTSRAILRPLPGAREEVLGLSRFFKCKALFDDDAQEKTFKDEAGNYGILHLAMHTMMNDSIPMFSKLVFANSRDSLEDGFLNTQEIYNMKLKARLAVLSACNTGSGKMRTGEGVMSMARAFLYAGCPSIVMTLWEVEDKSSAALVLSFYKYLFNGYSKPEALRRSKLDYLANADPLKAHPYFWMGYIVVGDPSPIKYSTSVVITLIVLAFVVVILLVFWRRIVAMLRSKGQ